MSNPIAEGTWPCTITSASAGEEVDQAGKNTGRIVARVSGKIDDGPSAGRQFTYEDEVNAKSSLYVARSLRAVGWKTADLATVASDVADWVKNTGGKSSVEIRHIPIKKGKKFDKWVADGKQGNPPIWDKANSLGRGPRALAAPSGDALKDANDAMRRALEQDGHSGGGGDGYDDAPPVNDDIPFVTSAFSADPMVRR